MLSVCEPFSVMFMFLVVNGMTVQILCNFKKASLGAFDKTLDTIYGIHFLNPNSKIERLGNVALFSKSEVFK